MNTTSDTAQTTPEVDIPVVPEVNVTADTNETNATVIPTLEEILAEVGDVEDETVETKTEL
jgi:hypothetical protein